MTHRGITKARMALCSLARHLLANMNVGCTRYSSSELGSMLVGTTFPATISLKNFLRYSNMDIPWNLQVDRITIKSRKSPKNDQNYINYRLPLFGKVSLYW